MRLGHVSGLNSALSRMASETVQTHFRMVVRPASVREWVYIVCIRPSLRHSEIMRTKTTAKRSLDLELKHFDKRHKVEPQTLRIDGDLFSLSALQRTLQDLQCVFCKDFSGGPIMRLDCSNPECSALQYFCKSHMETPSFRCDICWCCRRGGCRAADDHGVTKLFKRTLYTTCEKEGCLQLIIADDSETHLQKECTANFRTCSEMGCNKR